MNWLSQYANNIADSFFLPAIALTIVAAIIGAISFFQRDIRNRPDYSTHEYGNATWRMYASVQGVIAMWVIWGILNAVPAPDYIYREKTVVKYTEPKGALKYKKAFRVCMESQGRSVASAKDIKICDERALVMVNPKAVLRVPVPVRVSYAGTYRNAFEECRKGMGDDFTDAERKSCNYTAIALSKPNGVLVRTKIQTKIKKIYLVDPYSKLYEDCIGYHKVVASSDQYLNENVESRMGICHKFAMNVREGL